MTSVEHQNVTASTSGLVLRGTARYYDLLAWLVMRGREGAFREKVVDLARIRPGDRVLTNMVGVVSSIRTALKMILGFNAY